MYWTDDRYNRIWMANLNGSDATTVITTDLSCPGWISHKVIFTPSSGGYSPHNIVYKQ